MSSRLNFGYSTRKSTLLIFSKINAGILEFWSWIRSYRRMMLGPPVRFLRILISLWIFFNFTGFKTLITHGWLFKTFTPVNTSEYLPLPILDTISFAGRYAVGNALQGGAPLDAVELYQEQGDAVPEFGRLVACELVSLNSLPVWLVGSTKTAVFGVFSANLDTQAFFADIMMYSDFANDEIVAVLLESDNPSRYLVVYPELSGQDVLMKAVLVDLDNEFVRRAHQAAAMAGNITVGRDEAVFVEPSRLGRENSVLEQHLQKRGQSRKPARLAKEPALIDRFNKTLERLILAGFDRFQVQSTLSKDECKELYGIVFKSARFLFRNQLRQQSEPEPDKLTNVVNNTIQLHLGEI
ncbi:hypothetical protein OGAPHI_006691 [Ogataea philodendri]|uniref:Sld7 C-terminal domain-containing protein n=1 Tax=Ogataea philodendri TaxID=1378263 RepID=A0A9P8NXK4_9ASCO|nr:uncharacterized protein OGAPHI_006691 [Ogataea philodendri]KAH3661284.1 hypothetical protein OGAPHI_006691 [Ogataea philodendri]